MEDAYEITAVIEADEERLRAYSDADEAVLLRAYAPGKWCGRAILAHLADADMVLGTRIHQAIVEPGNSLFVLPYDQDLWQAALHAAQRPVDVSLAAIRGARLGVLYTLRAVPVDILERELSHEEAGTVTPLRYARAMARHGSHHLAQLDALRDGLPWEETTCEF
jgi:hypothetical protein